MYKALIAFDDKNGGGGLYAAGDEYPHEGVKVSDVRIDQLLSSDNKTGKPVIKHVEKKAEQEQAIFKVPLTEDPAAEENDPQDESEESLRPIELEPIPDEEPVQQVRRGRPPKTTE